MFKFQNMRDRWRQVINLKLISVTEIKLNEFSQKIHNRKHSSVKKKKKKF